MIDERVGKRLYGPNPMCYCGEYLKIKRNPENKPRWFCDNCESGFEVSGVDYD